MDEVVKLLDAKPISASIDTNIGVWSVEKSSLLQHISKLYLLGMQYPSLFLIAGNDLFCLFELQDQDLQFYFQIKDQNPIGLKSEIIEAYKENLNFEAICN